MPNRLADQASPYLRQHRDNPVDWYPWGVEALDRARDEDKPILLSIGYAACHWCHVMAHESFEDAATAAFMNEHFVNVKVDREERPDIDAIYMDAAQAMSGQGGWPLTAFLTPSQTPFFAGTYFPPRPRHGMPSFMQLMESIAGAWRDRRDEIEGSSKEIVELLSQSARMRATGDPIAAETLEKARAKLADSYDPHNGGFGGAPKFPPHSVIDFLLGQSDERSREVALGTLRKIAAGGIHDQLGGGFSRYSVDERWQIPHFEKMLYDNALLARNYLHAWQVGGEDRFAAVCRDTLDWMLREMHGDEGGFAAALDADSLDAGGRLAEGAFYAWSKRELVEVIDAVAPDSRDDCLAYWGVSEHGEFDGLNVLAETRPERKPPGDKLLRVREALFDRRSGRPRPARDDKRIASWNALALAALAEAGAVLGERRFSEAAVACAEFIERELRLPDGRLRRSWLDGRAGPDGYLEDHAYVTAAYLTLYQSTFDERWFLMARATGDAMIEHFADVEGGGFFTTSDLHEQLLVRRKDMEDSPIPGGNAAASLALLRLSALTGDDDYRRPADAALRLLQPVSARYAAGFGHALQAIDFHLGPVREIALAGDGDGDLAAVIRRRFRPRSVLAGGAGTAVPLLAGREASGGRPAAYVCEDFACDLPVHTSDALRELLGDS